MSNVTSIKRKDVTVVLSDGKERPMKFTLNSMAILEEKYGTVDEAFKQLEAGKITAVRDVLYSAMLDDFNSAKEVGSLINIEDIDKISDALNSTISTDMPSDDDVAKTQAKVVGKVDPNN